MEHLLFAGTYAVLLFVAFAFGFVVGFRRGVRDMASEAEKRNLGTYVYTSLEGGRAKIWHWYTKD